MLDIQCIVVMNDGSVSIGAMTPGSKFINLKGNSKVKTESVNAFPVSTQGFKFALELALELKLQEARENLADGNEAGVNAAFIDAVEKIRKNNGCNSQRD